jgi:hypothetical protein
VKSPTWDDDLLARNRTYIDAGACKDAFEELVASAIAVEGYESRPVVNNTVRGFAYYDPITGETPFGFRVNGTDITFEIRLNGRARIHGGFTRLRQTFPLARIAAQGAWTLAIQDIAQAQQINQIIFDPDVDRTTALDGSQQADIRAADRVYSVLTNLVPDKSARAAILEQLICSSEEAHLIDPDSCHLTTTPTRIQLEVRNEEVFAATRELIVAALLCPIDTWPAIGDSYVEVSYESIKEPTSVFCGSHSEFALRQSVLQEAHRRFIDLAASQGANQPRESPIWTNSNRTSATYLSDMSMQMATALRRCIDRPHAVVVATNSLADSIGNEQLGLSPKDNPSSQEVSLNSGNVDSNESREDRAEQETWARTDIGPTTKRVLVDARRGQGLFRARVIDLERRCRVTGVDIVDHLRASHIKPWKDSTDQEKLDGNNGLLLAPHIDHLFDQGYISFTDCGDILIGANCPAPVLEGWRLSAIGNVGPFRLLQQPYLRYHRQLYNFGHFG